MYCFLNGGNNPSARKAEFFHVIQRSSEKSSGDFCIAERYLQPIRRERSVPLHTPADPTDLHARACRYAGSLLQHRALLSFCRAGVSAVYLLPGGFSIACMCICLMLGAVSIDSGKQTHPPAQPLVAVCFATALSVESRVATHLRCPLLVNWQRSIYVPLPPHPKSRSLR